MRFLSFSLIPSSFRLPRLLLLQKQQQPQPQYQQQFQQAPAQYQPPPQQDQQAAPVEEQVRGTDISVMTCAEAGRARVDLDSSFSAFQCNGTD